MTYPEFTEKDLPALPSWALDSIYRNFHTQEFHKYALATIDAYRKWLMEQPAAAWMYEGTHRGIQLELNRIDNFYAHPAGGYIKGKPLYAAPMPQAEQPTLECERCGLEPEKHAGTHWCDSQSFREASQPVQDEREAFEKSAQALGLDVRRDPPGYGDESESYCRSGTEYAWEGWQARAALAQAQANSKTRLERAYESAGLPSGDPDAQAQAIGQAAPSDDAMERALAELVDKIVPGLDTGDLVADAATASRSLDRALLSRYGQAPAVPEGWKLVPKRALAVLVAHAEARVHHVYNGSCPEEAGPHDQRDPECPVCAAITALDAPMPPAGAAPTASDDHA